jgi:uncharacterized protein (DUF1778 family)
MTKEDNKKNNKIGLRISSAEKEIIQLNASEAGMSLTNFIVANALGHNLPVSRKNRQVYKKLIEIRQIFKQIDSNLNQLVKTCHSGKKPEEPVSVSMQTIESTKETVDRGLEIIDRCILNQTNSNLLSD